MRSWPLVNSISTGKSAAGRTSFLSLFILTLKPRRNDRWDVCAGTIIAREAGANVYGRGGKPWKNEDLMDHYFFVVRAIGDTAAEKGTDAQDRIAREFFQAAEEWDV